MTLTKLTATNWFPITERIPVFAEHLNAVIDVVNGMADGGYTFDHIAEYTLAHGITFDNVINTTNGSVASPAIHGVSTNSGLFFSSGIVGFSTAGSHYAELTGDGSFQVLTTSTTGGLKAISGQVCPLIAVAAQNENVLTGAIPVTNFLSTIDTTAGATAYTLGAGAVVGQLKKILLRVDNGDATITGAFAGAATTLTFSDAGEYALLQWDGTDWIALELASALSMTQAPVIA
jgi:hypothetical protein